MNIICIKFPFGQVCGSPSLLHTDAYRVHCGNKSGTDMLAQQAMSVTSCMVILEHSRRNDGFFPLFSYLPIHSTEEDTGLSPARSTKLP